MNPTAAAALVAGEAVLGVGVPWLFVRMLVPSLRDSGKAHAVNYRGREVFYGLGVAWLVWAGCAIVGGGLGGSVARGATVLPILTLSGALALVAFAMGAVDDAYGSSAARGFKGHLKAMARGRLTTGGLKLIGIGAACLVVAIVASGAAPWGAAVASGAKMTVAVAVHRLWSAVLAGAAIALTSNFVNLTDLRPGRALKVYSVLAVLGAALAAFGLGAGALGRSFGVEPAQRAVDFVVLLLFVLGPVVATWRYDVGETGMLGDSGANPAGAVAGFLIVVGLPLWGLVAYLALMLGLNLASERYSFSRVIEGNTALSWLDRLGRSPDSAPTADSSEVGAHTGGKPE